MVCHLFGIKSLSAPNDDLFSIGHLGTNFIWNVMQNTTIYIQENAFQNVVHKMASILSQSQCANWLTFSSLTSAGRTVYTRTCDKRHRGFHGRHVTRSSVTDVRIGCRCTTGWLLEFWAWLDGDGLNPGALPGGGRRLAGWELGWCRLGGSWTLAGRWLG